MRLPIATTIICAAALLATQARADEQAAPAAETLRLGMRDAVAIALGQDGSARVRIARELTRLAESRAAQARAALLPNVDATVVQQSQTRNLAAFGLRLSLPIPGFSFPSFVGPYNVFDARATATQSVFDLAAIRRYQASRAGVSQAEAEKQAVEEQVRQQVARAYLAVLRADAAVSAERANTELSDRLLRLADNQKNAGTGTAVEVTRSRVQLANQRQRLLVAENELHRASLQLLRAIGLDLAAKVELTERLVPVPVDAPAPEAALQLALESRPDWKAQELRERVARLGRESVRSERVPSVSVFGDYGSSGSSPSESLPTRAVGVAIRIPLFDGGRRDARRAESTSVVLQEELRTKDLRAQVELEVRLALDNLRSTKEQVRVAEEGLSLAETELAQAQRRYEAGMAPGIEVTDAQARLERARDNRISALFAYNAARIDLGAATGTLSRAIQ
jgi:outer membrane protein